jgi:hypothetical protein
MKLLIMFIFTAASFASDALVNGPIRKDSPITSISWTDTKNWKLYYTLSKDAFSYPIDTLKTFKSIGLKQDSMILFLQSVTDISTQRTPVWMGYYIATCTLANGVPIKIIISQYGRFFYDQQDGRYYQLSENVQDVWLTYLNAKWLQLQNIK